MEISGAELRTMLQDAAEMGARKALTEAGHIKPFLSKREADRMYGRALVERWIDEGLVTPEKDGTNTSKIRISREQIHIVATSSNRMSWFNHREAV